MGLRDALDAGRDEIRSTAKRLIETLGIEAKIKQAVIVNDNSISLSFERSENMHVIQREVVRQIKEEGFRVTWKKSCCPKTIERNLDGQSYETYKARGGKSNEWKCVKCHQSVKPASGRLYGWIRISWDLSDHEHRKSNFNKGSI